MHSEPFSKSARDLNVQTLREAAIQFPYGLANSRADGGRRELAEFSDERYVIDGVV
jgi:hypothetical protein